MLLNAEAMLEALDGARVETSVVRIPSRLEVAWQVRAEARGNRPKTVRVGDQPVETRPMAGVGWRAVSQRRTGPEAWETLRALASRRSSRRTQSKQ